MSDSQEIASLRTDNLRLRDRTRALELQVSSLQQQINDSLLSSQRKLEEAQEQLRIVKNENVHLLDYYKVYEALDEKIRKAYIDLRDLTMETLSNADRNREEKELGNTPILILFDSIMHHLEILLNFRRQYEKEFDYDAQRKLYDESAITSLKNEIEKLRSTITGHAEILSMSIARIPTTRDTQTIIQNAKGTIDVLRTDNEQLVTALKETRSSLHEEQNAMERAKVTIKQQQSRLLKIAQLESRIHFLKTQHAHQLAQITSLHNVEKNSKTKIDRQKFGMELDNERLRREISDLKTELQSFKSDIPHQRIVSYEASLKRQEVLIKRKDEEIMMLKRDLRKVQQAGEILAKRNVTMKEEYDSLFEAATEEKKRVTSMLLSTTSQSMDGDRPRSKKRARSSSAMSMRRGTSASGPPKTDYSVVSGLISETPPEERVYRRIIQAQETKIQSLSNEVRRLLALDRKTKILEETRSREKARYENELAAMKMEKMALARRPNSSTMKRDPSSLTPAQIEQLIQRNLELEEQLKDYKNVRAVNETITQAYERVLHSTQDERPSETPNQTTANSTMSNHINMRRSTIFRTSRTKP
ncbi:hypothetical protein BLNAU_11569 [Blattamonas nauphoetae]|uniref:Uncharacterized protein n=1 Tax=Blattamonas nauphoetae TaxID=2049346 RepID=A0ABQ9XPK2_9EUKA|nr:hypothetical protein BLNAU_11569 [Blattamonas nauphoetae]